MRAAQIATSHSGTIVSRKGRSVSLAECDCESRIEEDVQRAEGEQCKNDSSAMRAPICVPLSGRRVTRARCCDLRD